MNVKDMNKDWKILNYNVPIEVKQARTQQTESMAGGMPEDDDGCMLIYGTAINETITRNGHKFIARELEYAAPSLRNKPILKDHNNSVEAIVGRVTENAFYNPMEKKVMFEGRVMDPMMKQMIKDGRINSVSIGAMCKDMVESEVSGEEGVVEVQGLEFVELSLVAVPADPNAGFAMAMCESFDLKKSTQQLPKTEIKNKEEPTMAEEEEQTAPVEETQTEVEAPVLEEVKKEVKLNLDVDTSKIDESIAKMKEYLSLQEQIKKVEAEKIVEEKKVTEEKIKVEDKTQGEVTVAEKKTEDVYHYIAQENGKISLTADLNKSNHKTLMR